MEYADKKKYAVLLRKQGKTYSEILKEVPVAKSTLSLWLRDVRLSKPQQQRITAKRLAAQRRGADSRHRERIQRTKQIQAAARSEIGKLTDRELWLIGIALYWAEGSKEKENGIPNSQVELSSSDSRIIELFLLWLIDVCGVKRSEIRFGIYVHENHKNRMGRIKRHWSKSTGFSIRHFDYVYFKRHNPKTLRKNTGDSYYGNLRVRVRASSDFNRRIAGWIQGVYKHSRIV